MLAVSETRLSKTQSAAYRTDIEGLRGIAVLSVLLFHAGSIVPGGFVGVDIFFVISGFLITGIIARELDAGEFSFAAFYARRIRRISPALFFILGLCAIAALFLLVPSDLKAFGHSVISTIFFDANWHYYKQVGYFDSPAATKPLLHTWSLAVEEQFYLLWPLMLTGLWKGLGKGALPYAILALVALSLAAAGEVGHDKSAAFYLLHYRAWELLLGGWLAVAALPPFPRWLDAALFCLGALAIFYSAFFFDMNTPFPGLNALFPCGGAALLILTGMRGNTSGSQLLSVPPLRFAGKISYSLYLVHWPIFSFTHLVIDRPLNGVEIVAAALASIAVATISWSFIETPARRSTAGFISLARAAAAGTVAFWAIGMLYTWTNGLPARVSKPVRVADDASKRGKFKRGLECLPATPPSLFDHPCAIGTTAGDRGFDFLIWGDSHALRLAPAFSGQARQQGLAGIVIWHPGCAPLLGDSRVNAECSKFNSNVANWIKLQTRLKAVFLAGSWPDYASAGLLDLPKPASGSGRLSVKPLLADGPPGLTQTLSFLQENSIAVTIVEDVPHFPFSVPACAARARMFGRDDERCFSISQTEFESQGRLASERFAAMAARFKVAMLSTGGVFCNGQTCRAEKNGAILYSDHAHLNMDGGIFLGSSIKIRWPSPYSRPVAATASDGPASGAGVN